MRKKIQHCGYEFEIVDTMPEGYIIWCIEFMEDYIPLCQVFPGTHNVDVDTLKAIKLTDRKECQIMCVCAHHGGANIKECEYYIKRYSNSKSSYVQSKVKLFKQGLEILNRFK